MRPPFRMRKVRGNGLLLTVIVLLFSCSGTRSPFAQTPTPEQNGRPSLDATHLWQPIPAAGPWLVHAGDDPRFADPAFDASDWTAFDISKSLRTLFPAGNPGVVWYRLRVKVAPELTGLAVREVDVSNAFAVYSNGVKLIEAGKFAPYVPYYTGAPIVARIPDTQIATGWVVLALRVHIDDGEWSHRHPGLYLGNIRLGRQDDLFQQRWYSIMRTQGESCLELLLALLLGATGLILFSAERNRREYLWLSLYAISFVLVSGFIVYSTVGVFPRELERLRVIPQFGIF